MNHHKKIRAARTRRKRHREYLHAVGLIRRAAPTLGGLFYTNDYLHGQNGWLNLYFLGQNKVVYSAALQTTRYAYKEAVGDLAWDEAEKLVPFDWFKKHDFVKDAATGLYVMQQEREPQLAEFDGLTRLQFVQHRERPIADARIVKVFEAWTLHYDHRFGVGLHATIDVPFLTTEAVQDFILRFLAAGEKPYRNDRALSYSYDEIPYWGVESNQPGSYTL